MPENRDSNLAETFAKYGGLGGLALFVFLTLFSRFADLKPVVGKLDAEQTYKLLMTFMILTFALCLFSLACWVYVQTVKHRTSRVSVLLLLCAVIFGGVMWATMDQTRANIAKAVEPTPRNDKATESNEGVASGTPTPLATPRPTQKSKVMPDGCTSFIKNKCLEYRFPVLLSGKERTHQFVKLTGLNSGDQISATFKGTVMPDAVDATGNGTNGDVAILVRPVGGTCPPGSSCLGRHPWPGNEKNWRPLEAHYQMTATGKEQQFEVEINLCSYKGDAHFACRTAEDAQLTFKIYPGASTSYAMPACVKGEWGEVQNHYLWELSPENDQMLRATRAGGKDSFEIVYKYQGAGLWESEAPVSIRVWRHGAWAFKRGKVTLKLKDYQNSCSELETNESSIVLRRK